MDLIVHSFISVIISSFRCSMGLMTAFGSFGMLHCKTDSAYVVICTFVSVCLWVCKSYMTILPVLLVIWLIHPVQVKRHIIFYCHSVLCLSIHLGQFKY